MTPPGLPVMVSVHPMLEFQLLRKELKGRGGREDGGGGVTSWNCLPLSCRGHTSKREAVLWGLGPAVSSSDLPQ